MTPWTVQSMEFSRPEYWSGEPIPSPGDLPNPGVEPDLLHCKWILYQLGHQGSPRILEWVAYPFSRGSSQPRGRTQVSCIAGRFFTKCQVIHKTPDVHHLTCYSQFYESGNPCTHFKRREIQVQVHTAKVKAASSSPGVTWTHLASVSATSTLLCHQTTSHTGFSCGHRARC